MLKLEFLGDTLGLSPLAVIGLVVAAALIGTVATRVIHCLFFHPLKDFPGPWYSACSSFPLGFTSVTGWEPDWLYMLAKRYGTPDGKPIRITPNLLFFYKAAALRDIYWDPKCNQKSTMYGHEGIGPTSIFQIIDGQEHRELRKALGGSEWAIGSLRRNWEGKVDDLIRNWKANQIEAASKGVVVLSNKVAEFAADVMSMVLFTQPWGFVRNDRDERGMLQAWRDGLPLFGLSQRWRFFREVVLKSRLGASLVLPRESHKKGNGWLIYQAGSEITKREKQQLSDEEKGGPGKNPPDFLQLTISARVGEHKRPLSAVEKLANITIFIQAGADTTGSGLGATLRFLATHPECMARARAEIDNAEKKGLFSGDVVQYAETKDHLPYMCAVIRESLRLNPPIPNIFPRVCPPEGKAIGGHFIPGGAEMTSQSYVVQRDADVFAGDNGNDVEEFRPERWLEGSAEKTAAMDANMYVFGMGSRVCIGKDIALLEMHKLVPEIIRRFDIDVIQEGRYVVVGGIASHSPAFKTKLTLRE